MPELSSEGCFHESSYPRPRRKVFWHVARGFAYKLVGLDPEGAAEAVAREAFRRVLDEEPPARGAARYASHRSMRRRPCQASLDYDQLQDHADVVDQQLAWNRARPGMLTAGGRWVNYEADASFVDWISGYDSGASIGPERRLAHVLPIPELAPMPEDILRAYFKSCKWQPRSDEEGRR